jgi:oligopeptide transport system substrate-binding protein
MLSTPYIINTIRRRIRFRGLLPLLITLLAGLAACDAERPQEEVVLQRGLAADPESLDPHKSRSTEAGDVLRDLGEGLLGYGPEGELELRAAASYEVSDDGLLYTFRLRPDARWSNGATVTAEDFVFAFRRLVSPETAAFYAHSVTDVENAADILAGKKPVQALSVTAAEAFVLRIRLAKPTPYFLALLTHPSTFPVYAPAAVEHGEAFARPGRFVTNGAYRLVDWQLGATIDLQRNEHYWNDSATAIDRVRYHVIPEPMVELIRYRAGELHVTSNVPSQAFERLREERPDELRVRQRLGVNYYGLNLTRPPFKDNPKLRQALSMAVDREVLTEKIIGRGEAPAYSWVPPGVYNYEPRRLTYADLTAEERRAAARRAYSDAGYGEHNPLQVEIRYNTSDTNQRIALAIQSMWRDTLGVQTTLINEEFQVLLSNVQAMAVTEVFRLSWSGDYNDAHAFLQVLQSNASSNLAGYRSEEFDRLMQQAAEQTDAGRRRLYLEEAEGVLLADHPVIPIYFAVSKHLVSPRVGGWGDNVLDYHYSQHLSLHSQQ